MRVELKTHDDITTNPATLDDVASMATHSVRRLLDEPDVEASVWFFWVDGVEFEMTITHPTDDK